MQPAILKEMHNYQDCNSLRNLNNQFWIQDTKLSAVMTKKTVV